jgi:hypothetical protein
MEVVDRMALPRGIVAERVNVGTTLDSYLSLRAVGSYAGGVHYSTVKRWKPWPASIGPRFRRSTNSSGTPRRRSRSWAGR